MVKISIRGGQFGRGEISFDGSGSGRGFYVSWRGRKMFEGSGKVRERARELSRMVDLHRPLPSGSLQRPRVMLANPRNRDPGHRPLHHHPQHLPAAWVNCRSRKTSIISLSQSSRRLQCDWKHLTTANYNSRRPAPYRSLASCVHLLRHQCLRQRRRPLGCNHFNQS